MFESVSTRIDGVADCLVVGVFDDKKAPNGIGRLSSNSSFRAVLTSESFSGKPGELVEVVAGNRRVIIIGLGSRKNPGVSEFANAAGRRLALHGVERAQVVMNKGYWCEAGYIFGVLSWRYESLKGSATTSPKRKALELILPSEDAKNEFDGGFMGAQGTNFARDLSQTPPNIATPEWMASQAEALAKSTGMSCKVFRGGDLDKHKLTGLKHVGLGSQNGSVMIRLEYKSKSAKGKPLVLVGKTMTYDTGGLSLKVNNGMVGMKRDKDGGCAVLGAMKIIAEVLKPDRPVVALLVAAENSVGPAAYRPDDVLTYPNGVTVEITNTDAEGRLVLADGLCWACAQEDPAAVVDIATLTGGVVTALGAVYAGYFTEDSGLQKALESSSEGSRERIWRLPLHSEYRDMMKSPVADILNSNPNRQAHPIQGAAFLSYFVEEGIPWAHIDIAGVHATEKDRGALVPGPTGFGARLLAELARRL